MRIGIDGSRAFVKDRTGTENYSYQILKSLAKIDTENNYLVFLRPGNEINISDWPANFKFKILNLKFLWTQLGLALESFISPIDILFVPSHTLPLIRKPGLKTVMTVHDLGAEYLPGLHQLKQRLYLGFITKFQLKSASRLIAVSKSTKADLIQKIGIGDGRIEVIYEGLNPLVIGKSSLGKFGLKDQSYLLFVGTVQPRKNLERLIEAFSKIKDQKLILVIAGGSGWLSDSIYKAPERLGIEARVKFLGRVPDDDLGGIYQGAKAFLFPSLFEGFGLPILEAMSLGVPVLTSNISSMKEIAGDSAILIEPLDIVSISNGIDRIIKPESRSKLIKKGKERVKQFSWDKAGRETLNLFKEINNG